MAFIYRDYGTPVVIAHTNKIAIKSLFGKTCSRRLVDGVEVMDIIQWYDGDNGQWGANGIRWDSEFRRFCNCLGIKKSDLQETDHLHDLKWIGYTLKAGKYTFEADSIAQMTNRYNYKYLSYLQPEVKDNTHVTYDTHVIANQLIGSITTGPGTYTFTNGTAISDDGYYTITSFGGLSINELALTDQVNIVGYTTDNTRIYSITRTYLEVTYVANITITPIREYIDLRITVGGSYVKSSFGYRKTTGGIPDMMDDLPVLRASVEADPIKLLGNIGADVSTVVTYDYEGVEIGTKEVINTLGVNGYSFAAGSVEVDIVYGHPLDVTALIDNAELFECIHEAVDEKVVMVTVAGSMDEYENGNSAYSMQYEYTKRYRLKPNANATDMSQVMVKMKAAADVLTANANSRIQSRGSYSALNDYLSGRANIAANNAALDSVFKVAIRELTSIQSNPNLWFYSDYLRADAFDSMTANEFSEVLSECFDVVYEVKKKKNKWGGVWGKIVGIVIIIIAIIVAIVVTIFLGPAAGMAAASMVLALGGAIMAKHFPEEAGMIKFIGVAAQITGIVALVMSGYQSYEAYMAAEAGVAEAEAGVAASLDAGEISVELAVEAMAQLSNYATMTTVMFTLEATTMGLGLLSATGIGGEEFQQYAMIATAAAGLAYGAVKIYDSGILSDSIIKDVSGGLKLLRNGADMYTGIINLGVHNYDNATEEQSIKEDGIEAQYVLRERSMENDALYHISYMKEAQFGGAKTEALLRREW